MRYYCSVSISVDRLKLSNAFNSLMKTAVNSGTPGERSRARVAIGVFYLVSHMDVSLIIVIAYVSESRRPVHSVLYYFTPHAHRPRAPGNVSGGAGLSLRNTRPMSSPTPPFCSFPLSRAIMSDRDSLCFHMWNTCFVSIQRAMCTGIIGV